MRRGGRTGRPSHVPFGDVKRAPSIARPHRASAPVVETGLRPNSTCGKGCKNVESAGCVRYVSQISAIRRYFAAELARRRRDKRPDIRRFPKVSTKRGALILRQPSRMNTKQCCLDHLRRWQFRSARSNRHLRHGDRSQTDDWPSSVDGLHVKIRHASASRPKDDVASVEYPQPICDQARGPRQRHERLTREVPDREILPPRLPIESAASAAILAAGSRTHKLVAALSSQAHGLCDPPIPTMPGLTVPRRRRRTPACPP